MRRGESRQAGFTLLELVVGCVIIGIVLAAAVPNLRSYRESQRMAQASELLATACRTAQARARSENHPVVIEYRGGDNAYAVVDDENGNGAADAGETVIVHQLGAGVSLGATTFPGDRLVFDSRGRATEGGNIVLRGGDRVLPKQVRISAGTGYVKIRSGDPN